MTGNRSELIFLESQTYSSQWNFDQNWISISASAVQAVIAAGKTTTFTFEFYPRSVGNGNYFNYTLTV
jgi:endoglucanase